MAELVDIINGNTAFKGFLTSEGKTIDTTSPPEISLIELATFRAKITRWNARNPTNKIVKIGFYTVLVGTKVTTHLVGLDAAGRPVRGGGGVGEGPPHYR